MNGESLEKDAPTAREEVNEQPIKGFFKASKKIWVFKNGL